MSSCLPLSALAAIGSAILTVALAASASPAGAANAIKLQNPPVLGADGACTSDRPSQFTATYERHGVFDDTSQAKDRYVEYLIDGSNTVLDARSRTVTVNTWERATATLKTAATPRTGLFRIVIYEEADSIPPLAVGSRADFDAALIRQDVRFDASALDSDCPVELTD
jgi:hypothetical protein